MTQIKAPSLRSLALACVLVFAALIGFAALALAISGSAAPLQLADPGPLVRWGLPIFRGITDLTTAVAIGAVTMALFATSNGTWQLRRLLDLAGAAATVW